MKPSFRFRLDNPTELATPCLLFFPDVIRSNIAECIRIAGDASRLRPHVKTHKTAEIVYLERDSGIHKHKCATLSEARMLCECGVAEILIAYPQVGPNISRLADIIAAFPGTQIAITVENARNAGAINDFLQSRRLSVNVYLDIDVGMHRTGIDSGPNALALADAVAKLPHLKLVGLHAYDGHNHLESLKERTHSVEELIKPLQRLVEQMNASNCVIKTVVCGGTPTFPIFASVQELAGAAVELSPGTCILSDYGYASKYADLGGFQFGAMLMSRVISKQHDGHVTIDLGHKAVAGDPPAGGRCYFPEIADAVEVKQNEEHLVVRTSQADSLQLGDEVYVVPTHICPTVALHSHVHIVEEGKVTGRWRVASRDRIY